MKNAKSNLAPPHSGDSEALPTEGDAMERRAPIELSRRAEATLSAAQALVHFGTWEVELIDPDHLEKNPAQWSNEVFRILGYEPGTVQPSSEFFLNRVHPEDRPGLQESVRRAIAARTEFSELHRIIRPSGEVRHLREHGRLLPPEEGNGHVLFVGAMHDVTDEQKTERKFRALVEMAPDAIVIIDASRQIVLVNSLAEQLFGYTRAQMIGQQLSLLLPDRFREAHARHEVHFLRGPHARPMGAGLSLAARRADGSEFPVEISLSPIQTDDGLLVAGSIRDITERERMLEKVREQAMLIDKAADAIVVRDVQDRILVWNHAAEKLFGQTAAQTIGRPANGILRIDPTQLGRARAAVLEQGEWSGELRMQAERRVIILQSHWTLVRDAQGAPKSILGIFSDITEQKRIEAQVYRAQRMESIGTLAGGIAHDLNNILTPIVMAADTLRDGITRPEDNDTLAIIAQSARRGTQVLRQVLAFARGFEGERIALSPALLVRDMGSMVRETFPKSIAVTMTIERNLYSIVGDPTQLQQVLLNLCVNARDAMPQGGKLILTAENVDLEEEAPTLPIDAKPGPYVRLAVRDTGIGIPTDLQDKIFEPFFTTKKHGEGTGLGLATCQAIVRSHDGFIRVTSQPSAGAEFAIYLPADASNAPGKETTLPPALAPCGHGELLLVIDDEEPVRTIVARILEGNGYRVLLAKDGAEAVAQYSHHQTEIAAVVTDMAMPVMDGAVTILTLRKIDPSVRIIAMSGMDSLLVAAAKAGATADRVLHKPFTAEAILHAISEVLTMAR